MQYQNISVSFRLSTYASYGLIDAVEYPELSTVDTDVRHFEQVWTEGEKWVLEALTLDGWKIIDSSENRS